MSISRRTLILVLTAIGLNAAFMPLLIPAEILSLSTLAERILGYDPSVKIAEQSVRLALSGYRGTVAQALPQLSLNSSYALQYTPEIMYISQINVPPYLEQVERRDKGSHNLSSKISLSQILPTGGNLSLSAESTTNVETGEDKSGSAFTAMEPEYSQSPKLSLAINQPVFLNRKLVDLELFPATFRKARIGYLKEQSANREARNQALAQGLSLFFTVIELRRSIATAVESLKLTEGKLRNLEQSYRLGKTSETDVWELRITLGQQNEQLLELRYRVAQAQMSLSQSLGVDSLERFELLDEIPQLAFSDSREQVMAAALLRHPAIEQNGLAAEEKSLDRVLGGQQHASTLSLALSVAPRYPYLRDNKTVFGDSFSQLLSADAGIDYSLQVGLSVPIYEGGKKTADQEGFRALEAIAGENLQLRRKSILQDVASLFLKKENLERKVSLLHDNAELLARRLQMESDLLSLGKSTELDVLAKRIELESKETESWRARADLFLTLLQLYRAMGRDLQELIKG